MIPTFAFPGESAPGQFGPSIVIPPGPTRRRSRRKLHRAPSRIQHGGLDIDRPIGLPELRSTFFGVRPVKPHDDRMRNLHLVERLEDPARDLVTAGDAPED